MITFPTDAVGSGSLSPQLRPPVFVGRGREVAELTEAFAVRPALVLVEGEAGIGKSRLISEFLAARDDNERLSLVAVCPPLPRPHSLGPLVDAVRRRIRQLAGLRLSPLAGALRPVFPEWENELPPALEPAEDATAARHRLFRAFSELLECLGVTTLVVEDAHWADQATLEFLLVLNAQGGASRISLLVSYRPHEIPAESLLRRLSARASSGLRLSLTPLDVTGTAALVSSMLGDERLSPGFADLLYHHTDGVPLAVEQTVRLMREQADLIPQGGSWVRRRLTHIGVPPTIRDTVLEHVQSLDPRTRAVLHAAAVLTDPADELVLRAVCELGELETQAGLNRAIMAGLLMEDEQGLIGFRHALPCRAVYESIPVPERRRLHQHAGRVLEAGSPPAPSRLAHHFHAAGDITAWCSYAEQAADLALVAGDETSAAALLHSLLIEATLPSDTVVRLIRKMRSSAVMSPEMYRELAGSLHTALRDHAVARPVRAELRYHLGRMLVLAQEFDIARTELRKAIPDLGHRPVEAVRAMLLLGWPLGGEVLPAASHRRWLRRAAQFAATAEMRPEDRLDLIVDRMTGLLLLGDDEGWAEAEHIPSDAPTAAQRLQVVRGRLNAGAAAALWGRYHEARQWLTSAAGLAERYHYPLMNIKALKALAELDWYAGQWTGLAERAERFATDEDTPPQSGLELRLVTGLLRAAGGEFEQAETILHRVIEEARELGMPECAIESAAMLSRIRLADGRIAEALRLTEEPIRFVTSKQLWALAANIAPARVDALVTAHLLDEAELLVGSLARGMRQHRTPVVKAAVTQCQAIMTQARGDLTQAAAYARAAAAWQVLPRPYNALLARERQARCLLDLARRDEAVAMLRDVLRDLSDLGAHGDARRVARTLRQHGVAVRRPGAGRPSYHDRLSPRELDVARLVTDGLTNRDIAQRLFLSPKTVARHIDSAMRKLGVASRTALAVHLVETRLVADAARADAAHRPAS